MTPPVRSIVVGIMLLPIVIYIFKLNLWVATWVFRVPGLILVLFCGLGWLAVALSLLPMPFAVLVSVPVGQLYLMTACFHLYRLATGRGSMFQPSFASIWWRTLMGAVTGTTMLVSLIILDWAGLSLSGT